MNLMSLYINILTMSVGIAGLGFVGGAMYKSFTEKGQDCII